MQKHVLRIAVTKLYPPQQLHELGVNAMDPDVKNSLLPRLPDSLFYLLLRLAHNLFYPPRVDTAIGHELFQRQPGNFPTNGIMAGNDHGLRSIINDQINPRSRFQGADIASLTANNPTLHIVAGYRHDRNRSLSNKIA